MTKFQKEKLRQQRAQEKAQKKAERKMSKPEGAEEKPANLEVTYTEDGEVKGFDFHDF